MLVAHMLLPKSLTQSNTNKLFLHHEKFVFNKIGNYMGFIGMN